MKNCLLGVLVIGLLVAADEKKPDDGKTKSDDIKAQLAGVWNLISVEVGGKKEPEDDIKGATLTFEGDKVTGGHKGKKDQPATYKIDLTKKPAHLDVIITAGPQKGMPAKMIFVLEGDTLKLAAYDMMPGERPAGFDEKGIMIMTLKREKK